MTTPLRDAGRRLAAIRRDALANHLAHRFARFDRFTADAMPQKRWLWKNFLVSAELTQRLDFRFARTVDDENFFHARKTKARTFERCENADVIWVFAESRFRIAWLDAERTIVSSARESRCTMRAIAGGV